MKPYFETDMGKLYHGDCLEIMPQLERVDLVLTDPPYGKTQNSWDISIDINRFWSICRQSHSFVFTASQPFASLLIQGNLSMFKWEDIWFKTRSTGHLNCKIMPLRQHENILVFSKGKVKYNPQIYQKPYLDRRTHAHRKKTDNYGKFDPDGKRTILQSECYPRSVFQIKNTNHGEWGLHPTQKPIELFEYLLLTFSDTVNSILDCFFGSGTTAVACERLNRKWTGIEIEEKYCEIAAKRIEQENKQLKMFR